MTPSSVMLTNDYQFDPSLGNETYTFKNIQQDLKKNTHITYINTSSICIFLLGLILFSNENLALNHRCRDPLPTQ